MMNSEQGLPDGWTRTTIGESLKIVRGISFPKDVKTFEPKKGYIACLRTKNVQQEVEWDDLWFVPTKHVKREEQFIEPNDILISTANSLELVGKVAQVKTIPYESTLGAFISLIRVSNGLNPKFVYFQLASTKVQTAIRNKASTTTNISNISTGKLAEIAFGYPSVPEQERIVAKIEELFTQLEAGTSALERVQAGLRRYKASVLKAAVGGKLESVGADGVRPSPQPGRTPSARTGELPDGWRWVTVEELAAKEKYSITDGPFGSKLKTEHYKESGPRVIRLQNIGDGEFRDEKAHISQKHFDTLRRLQIFAGDLVIAGLGESLPRACMIPEYVGDAIVKADCIRFKPNSNVADTKYLLFALNSDPVKKSVAKVVHGVGRPRMNQQEIKAIPIPLPPLEEQQRIVAEVERRLSVAREVESVVGKALVRASRLRQSVLKSAFEGRLA